MKRFMRLYSMYWMSLPIAVVAVFLFSEIGNETFSYVVGSAILVLWIVLAIITEETNRSTYYYMKKE